jgi:hypothetical protein
MRIPLEIRVAYAGLNKFRTQYAPEKNGVVRATWGDQRVVSSMYAVRIGFFAFPAVKSFGGLQLVNLSS